MGVLLTFHQVYQPVGDSLLLSALVAGLPLYVLFVMLAVLRLPAWICAISAMLTAFVLAWLVWGMPFGITFGTATEGMAFGLWPISWIVLNAVFFHNLPVVTLGGLIAPILHKDTTATTLALSAMVGRQLPLFSIIIPAYLIVVLAGWRRMREVLPAVLVSNFVGPELTDIIAALVSMGCLAILLRYWRPAQVYRFTNEPAAASPAAPRRVAGGAPSPEPDLPGVAAAMGKSPFDVDDAPNRVWWAFGMYVVLVIVILIGQMGNLPFFSGHPV